MEKENTIIACAICKVIENNIQICPGCKRHLCLTHMSGNICVECEQVHLMLEAMKKHKGEK